VGVFHTLALLFPKAFAEHGGRSKFGLILWSVYLNSAIIFLFFLAHKLTAD